MEGIDVEYFPNSIYPGINEKSEFHSYISDYNEQYSCDSHAYMFHLFLKSLIRNISLWYVNCMERHQWLC